jgi:hypothetical protein
VSDGTRGAAKDEVFLGYEGGWWARQDLNLGPTENQTSRK